MGAMQDDHVALGLRNMIDTLTHNLFLQTEISSSGVTPSHRKQTVSLKSELAARAPSLLESRPSTRTACTPSCLASQETRTGTCGGACRTASGRLSRRASNCYSSAPITSAVQLCAPLRIVALGHPPLFDAGNLVGSSESSTLRITSISWLHPSGPILMQRAGQPLLQAAQRASATIISIVRWIQQQSGGGTQIVLQALLPRGDLADSGVSGAVRFQLPSRFVHTCNSCKACDLQI
jgi:hypothetical protein